MKNKLNHRGPDSEGVYLSKHAMLGHKRLTIIDPEGGKQPMIKEKNSRKFVIVYNGELYNTEDIRKDLKEYGWTFNSYSDTEVLLTSYMQWGENCLDKLNGIYAFCIWDEVNNKAFLARDRLGVKPLFYSFKNNNLVFASEIKSILVHSSITTKINREGLMEIFGLGPARINGSGIFQDIKEIPPGYYISFKNGKVDLQKYWDVSAELHVDSFDDTKYKLKTLLYDAVERQLISDVGFCTFLSGGLDSSIISYIASKANKEKIDTFTIDYIDNDKHFKKSIYQPNSDSEYSKLMAKYINSNHNIVMLNNENLADSLDEAVIAKDIPGMADVDSSLYLFCKEIKKKTSVALSGECADEIFGGYPWFHREEMMYVDTFPWSRTLDHRKNILSDKYKKLPLEDFVHYHYKKTLGNVPLLGDESPYEKRMKEIFYLNIKWFMITLLNRKDRMSMANSLEVRVPFADHRLVQYAYNIPAELKLYKGKEKGLLNETVKDMLPREITERKKSPYPKTHHPLYTKKVVKKMEDVLYNINSPILEIINIKFIKELIRTNGETFDKPWFGQLMTGPQVIALLYQINKWMVEYDVKLEV